MATAREYELTMQAIFHALNALPGELATEAHQIWMRAGADVLQLWADLLPCTNQLDAEAFAMSETLRDLCYAFNTMIEEDTRK